MLLRVATRKSRLALWQAEHVASLLRASDPTLEVHLIPMSTKGDEILDRSLAAIGGKGLFIKELELAIERGAADIAVHSMKDVPAELPPGFALGAVLPRADARDAFLSHSAPRLQQLPHGARVGTSSLRRQCQLRALRPDLQILPLRGNVETRLKRLDEGELDAVVLACAGLNRLGLGARITEALPTAQSLPAVGQGIIGIECRDADGPVIATLAAIHHAPTQIVLSAERAFAARLGGSCQSPIAGHARLDGKTLEIEGLVGEPDGSRLFRGARRGAIEHGAELGRELADQLLADGAQALLARLHG
jgi:hydroxymethylbilane synthase